MNNNDRKDQKGPNKPEPPRSGRKILTVIIIAVIVTVLLRMLTASLGGNAEKEIPYTEFEQMLQEGKIERVFFKNDRIIITPKSETNGEKK